MRLILTVLMFMLLAVSIPSQLTAQVKFEKEHKIDKEMIPDQALSFLDLWNIEKPIKWYREISESGLSLEAKFKSFGQRYSVEFDTSGVLQDVEIKMKKRELPNSLKEAIFTSLDRRFHKWKIRKIQKQFVGPEELIIEQIRASGIHEDAVQVNYEIIVSGRNGASFEQYELLFSHTGHTLKEKKIVETNTSNIEY